MRPPELRRAARHDAKAPYQDFVGDRARKQGAATSAIHAAAQLHLAEVHQRLETLRREGG